MSDEHTQNLPDQPTPEPEHAPAMEPTPGEWNDSPTTPLAGRDEPPDMPRRAQPISERLGGAYQPQQQTPVYPYPQPNAAYPYPYPYAPPRPQPRERGASGWVKVLGGCLVLVALLLACGAAVTGITWGMAIASEPATSTSSQTFSVTGTPTLIVDAAAANVQVETGSSSQITVKVEKEVRAITHGAARQALDNITTSATQDGNTVHVKTDSQGLSGPRFFLMRKLDVTITVPATTNLTANLSAGNMHVDDITGILNADLSAGNLEMRNVTLTGNSVLTLQAGNVDFQGAMQPATNLNVTISAGNATLSLPQNTDAHLDGTASAGNINVNGWQANISHQAAETTVSADLSPNPTGHIHISMTAGNVTVEAA
ncbi:MAG: hypothetical protein OJF49_003941 [Ktedonobacterales bacterium]|jgi:hypothetical protein|nr:MAG: hypothetical protein OJF49_003941 [Ktedonobacterales bacterium]